MTSTPQSRRCGRRSTGRARLSRCRRLHVWFRFAHLCLSETRTPAARRRPGGSLPSGLQRSPALRPPERPPPRRAPLITTTQMRRHALLMAGDTCKHVLDEDRTQPIFAVVPIDLPSGNHTVMIARQVSTVTPTSSGIQRPQFRPRSLTPKLLLQRGSWLLDLGSRAPPSACASTPS